MIGHHSPSRALLAAALACFACAASAQIKVGITISTTGPAASHGAIERNSVALLPRTIAGQSVEYIVMDDTSEPNVAVRNVRKLTDDDHVDVIIGSTTTPNSMALLPVVAEAGTPLISIAAGKTIIFPVDQQRRWAFKSVHNDQLMIDAVISHMVQKKIKRLGYIGLADAGGEGYLNALQQIAPKHGIELIAIERYGRSDQSVTAQALRLVAAKPDAIFVGSFTTLAALPQIALTQRGYRGIVYHTNGVVTPDFLRVAGSSAEGTYMPTAPIVVVNDLADSNPIKKVAKAYIATYEAKYGAGSFNPIASYVQDASMLIETAVPKALAKAKPGTPEFRAALRDAMEQIKGLVTTQGVVDMTPQDHLGLDARSRVMVQVKNGKWVLAP